MFVLERSDSTRRLTLQVFCCNWLLGIINNFLSIFLLLICLRNVNWIHWKTSSTTNISTREIRRESFCASSITSAFYNLNPGYNFPFIFFITPQGMLVSLLFLACWFKFAWRHREISKWLSSIWNFSLVWGDIAFEQSEVLPRLK